MTQTEFVALPGQWLTGTCASKNSLLEIGYVELEASGGIQFIAYLDLLQGFEIGSPLQFQLDKGLAVLKTRPLP